MPDAGLTAGARYVALGSSFAAGPGISPRVPGSPRKAGRSAANYAHLIAQRFGLTLDDVTYSGATTHDILTARDDGWPAQVDAVTADTRLATITCGGNDLGYVPRLLLSSLPWPVRALPSIRRRADADADPELMETRFGELTGRLAQIATQVHRRAPDCRLIFVDYLTLLPPDAGTHTGALPAEVAAWGRGVARKLSEVTRAAAEDSAAEGHDRCDFAPAGVASMNHHAWSAVPWTRRFHLGLRGGAPYHPNAVGMAAVADLVADILTTLAEPPRWSR
jgi:lysophospholipase L1-like esterase